jgi:hypothetical protein
MPALLPEHLHGDLKCLKKEHGYIAPRTPVIEPEDAMLLMEAFLPDAVHKFDSNCGGFEGGVISRFSIYGDSWKTPGSGLLDDFQDFVTVMISSEASGGEGSYGGVGGLLIRIETKSKNEKIKAVVDQTADQIYSYIESRLPSLREYLNEAQDGRRYWQRVKAQEHPRSE